MRLLFAVTALLALAACASEPPASSGAGFESYPDYLRNREAQLGGAGPSGTGGFSGGITGGPISGGPIAVGPIAGGPIAGGQIAGGQIAGGPIAGGAGNGVPSRGYAVPAGIAQRSGEMDALAAGTGISDEQDFSAVSSRESIESDAARLAQQRAQYQQIAPTALPQRTSDAPNIVQYALQTGNPVGVQAYRRGNPLRNSQHERSCARYASQDLAQEDFLRRGGPDRDPRSLDPDGDGFACRWDPTPFRAAVN